MKRLLVVGVISLIAISVSGCAWPRCFSKGDRCSGGAYQSRMIDSQMIDGQILDGQVYDGQAYNGQIFDGQIVEGETVDAGPRGNP